MNDTTEALVMQLWLDDTHGRVQGGVYHGNLLRGGVCDGPYIDMLMPGLGWERLDSVFMNKNKDPENLRKLKRSIDKWLAA